MTIGNYVYLYIRLYNYVLKYTNSGRKIGVDWKWVKESDELVVHNFRETISLLVSNGFEIIDINIPFTALCKYKNNPAACGFNLVVNPPDYGLDFFLCIW